MSIDSPAETLSVGIGRAVIAPDLPKAMKIAPSHALSSVDSGELSRVSLFSAAC
jgi:hypothetical protein